MFNFIKKFILIITLIVVVIFFIKIKKAQKDMLQSFTVEWHAITKQTYQNKISIFEQLKPVYFESFINLIKPYIYATDNRLLNIPIEKKDITEKNVINNITQSLQLIWTKKIEDIYNDLQNKKTPTAYIAIVKDNKQKIAGFTLFIEKPINDYLKSNLDTITKKFTNSIFTSQYKQDQVYVSVLAVSPAFQKMGVGKLALFSVLKHCPNIKNIYLSTAIDKYNKNAQDFYEHIGFIRLIEGTFINDKTGDKDKIVYLYQIK